ncbi:unnamed protein product [Sphenostylis stenocarpa]|uniref:Uncharacterized protein n=1 Tax=Sphenostylis stenocarpa TaxID=92480 RepID=A0AA86S8G1_9FABA|nr:unnamed protein product [Sphenostylis stenocarpa]
MITGKIGRRPHVVAVHETGRSDRLVLPKKLAEGLGWEQTYPSSDGTRMFLFNENFLVHHDNISKFHVKPSALPDSWKLREIFVTGVVSVSDIALTELDLNVIISTELTSRAISQMMKNYSKRTALAFLRRLISTSEKRRQRFGLLNKTLFILSNKPWSCILIQGSHTEGIHPNLERYMILSSKHKDWSETYEQQQGVVRQETGRRYPSFSVLGESNDVSVSALPVEKLIVKADGLGEEFPAIDLDVDVEMITGDQLAIAKKMGRRKHTLELFVADCARSVSDIALTKLDLNVIISTELTNRAISQMMKNYSGYIMTISKFHVKPSPLPDSWKLRQIFVTGVVLDSYFAFKLEPQMTVIFLPHE